MSAADDLLSYAEEHPEGFSWWDAACELDLTHKGVHRAVADVRRYLDGSADPRVLVFNRDAGYCLVTGWTAQAGWQDDRAKSIESQLVTIEAAARAAIRTTARGTVEGRRARVMVKMLGRLVEDLAELREVS